MNHKRPIIGIVARPGNEDNIYNLAIFEDYRKAIILSGGNPMAILPPQLVSYDKYQAKELEPLTIEEKDMLKAQLDLCDGILMPGGTRRYEYDMFITSYAMEYNIPILGICLGMQLLATYTNRDTLKEITPLLSHSQPGVDKVHKVKIKRESKLFDIIGGEEIEVNSRHKYQVTETGTFTKVGFSEDGIVEAIECRDKKFAIGVQWHPENLMDTEPSRKLFQAFIRCCR